MAGSRVRAHQLSNGLYVSGTPDQYKERQPTMGVMAMPYTGGDIKKSGELGKMFDIAVEAPKLKKSGPITGSRPGYSTSGPLNSAGVPWQASNKINNPQFSVRHASSHSGPLLQTGDPAILANSRILKTSGPLSPARAPGIVRQNSGSMAPNLPATGLITSGPIYSGRISSSGDPRKYSGPIETGGSKKYSRGFSLSNQAINKLSYDLLRAWSGCWGKGAITSFMNNYREVGLNNVKDGQYVKVTGVVTCGSIPLQTSFKKVNRCVYTSTKLYEYRGLRDKPARSRHPYFTWALRHLECHVVDFYISDFHSGLRALVKTGYSAKVIPYVKDETVLDIKKEKELPSNFLHWLAEHNLSRDDRVMRLKEGYIKEGSTVTVMGVVQRLENVLMIVPPPGPVSTGCQLGRLLLPTNFEGIILKCDDNSKMDAIPV